jgi:hypothetical protein
VLKKAGIIVTASVAGLLAVAPLAFAAPGHDKPPTTAGETAEPPAGPTEGGNTITFTDDHSCRGGDVVAAQSGLLSLVGGLGLSVPFLNCNDVNVLSNQANNGA